MRYGSVCSGIEAASVAWGELGWRPSFFAEIDAFPRAVLAHHYPDDPLHGDFTTIEADQYAAIDVLVGGTPCQSFSVAGLRAGLADERGNLALEFCRLARRLGPRWVVWENVPGVLSLDGGRAFASILGGLAECGYGLAYRVLDAQYVRVDGFGRAVPQRRRRVFVVGCAGSWQRAAAVLFERQGLSWDSPPRREARQGVAPTLSARPSGGGGLGTDFDCDGGLIHFQGRGTNLEFGGDVAGTLGTTIDRASGSAPCIAHTLNAKGGAGRSDFESETLLPFALQMPTPHPRVAVNAANGGSFDVAPTLGASLDRGGTMQDAANGLMVAHALRADGFDASEDGTGRGTPLTVCFDETQITSSENRCNPQPGDPCHPLAKGARPPTLAFNARQDPDVFDGHTGPLDTDGSTQGILSAWRVRRLTPVECERLQGFPDGYTAIPYRGKPAADGPRYKALGNSMAVNVMRWLGRRIEMVEAIERRAVA